MFRAICARSSSRNTVHAEFNYSRSNLGRLRIRADVSLIIVVGCLLNNMYPTYMYKRHYYNWTLYG